MNSHKWRYWLVAGICIVVAMLLALPQSLDILILEKIAGWRSPLLTYIFENITALGSLTLISLHTAIALALLLSTGDKTGAIQLAAASAGSWTLTETTKYLIARPRPTIIPALAEASGFSYPSGHAFTSAAMYITIAFLASRHLPLRKQRVVLAIVAGLVIAAIAFSRVYLGVHYPSDILSGILLGVGWAVLVDSVRARGPNLESQRSASGP